MLATKNQILPVIPDRIPEALKSRPQWANLKAERRGNAERLDKIPERVNDFETAAERI